MSHLHQSGYSDATVIGSQPQDVNVEDALTVDISIPSLHAQVGLNAGRLLLLQLNCRFRFERPSRKRSSTARTTCHVLRWRKLFTTCLYPQIYEIVVYSSVHLSRCTHASVRRARTHETVRHDSSIPEWDAESANCKPPQTGIRCLGSLLERIQRMRSIRGTHLTDK